MSSQRFDVIVIGAGPAGELRVEVEGVMLQAGQAVVLAVGSAAALPPIPGLAQASAWTNREATTTKHLPARLIVRRWCRWR